MTVERFGQIAAPRVPVPEANRARSTGLTRVGSWQRARRSIDRAAAERAARDLLTALGADLESEGLRETPRRMADTYVELLHPEPFNLTTFPNDGGYDELVVVRDIPFQSLCMHHVLPFYGRCACCLSARGADPGALEARARG